MTERALSRDDRTLSTAATVCAVLVFIVVAASAWLRLAAVPCPAGGCEGFGFADAVRLAHRVAAMGVTVIALVIVAMAWKAPARTGRRVAAIVLLILVAALALVGRSSAGSPPPAVVMTNLLGGLTLLAATVGLAAAARTPSVRPSLPFAAALVAFVVAATTGGMLASATPTDSALLGLVHRGFSWATLTAWGLLAISGSSSPGTRLATRLAAAILATQVLLAIASPGWPLARWLHNLLTSAALCAAVAAAIASRATVRHEPAPAESVTARS